MLFFYVMSTSFFFFFTDTATTEIYTLSLHDALLVWLTPDLRIKKSLLKCNWTIRKRLPRCKMRLKKRLLAFSRQSLLDRKSGSAGMPRPISYAVFCLKKKNRELSASMMRGKYV